MRSREIELRIHVGLGPVEFGMSADDLMRLDLGANTARETSVGLSVDFPHIPIRATVVRDRVVEVSATPPAVVLFDDVAIFGSPDIVATFVAEDPDFVDQLGFRVFPKLGIALTGLHDGDDSQISITVFEPGFWDEILPR